MVLSTPSTRYIGKGTGKDRVASGEGRVVGIRGAVGRVGNGCQRNAGCLTEFNIQITNDTHYTLGGRKIQELQRKLRAMDFPSLNQNAK